MDIRKKILARRRLLASTRIEADAFQPRDLQMLMRKFAPANWIKVDEDDFSTTVTAYVTGVSPKTLISGAIRAVESFRGSTFVRDFAVPVVKHIDVNSLYGISIYTICFTCADRDARIFVNIMDDNVGCTVSLCQDTSPSA
nr:MAG TPA: hypothetical protein [Caudoviricetes sp.]